jgi:hypothetical protein
MNARALARVEDVDADDRTQSPYSACARAARACRDGVRHDPRRSTARVPAGCPAAVRGESTSGSANASVGEPGLGRVAGRTGDRGLGLAPFPPLTGAAREPNTMIVRTDRRSVTAHVRTHMVFDATRVAARRRWH